jgi:hypothetical protein
MSYFSSWRSEIGNSLNNAIENVANVVAPVDDYDDGYSDANLSFEQESPPPRRRRGSEGEAGDDNGEDGNNSAAFYAAEAERKQEEIDFLKTKVQSLSIELADRGDREQKLNATIIELNESSNILVSDKISDLEEKGMETWVQLNRKQTELDAALQQCRDRGEAAERAEEACHLLQAKLDEREREQGARQARLEEEAAVGGGDSTPPMAEHSLSAQYEEHMMLAVTAFDALSRQLDGAYGDQDNAITSVSDIHFSLNESGTSLDQLIDSWAAAASLQKAEDVDFRNSLKETIRIVGVATQRGRWHREGSRRVAAAGARLTQVFSEHGVAIAAPGLSTGPNTSPNTGGGDGTGVALMDNEHIYEAMEALMCTSAETLAVQYSIGQATTERLNCTEIVKTELISRNEELVAALNRQKQEYEIVVEMHKKEYDECKSDGELLVEELRQEINALQTERQTERQTEKQSEKQSGSVEGPAAGGGEDSDDMELELTEGRKEIKR